MKKNIIKTAGKSATQQTNSKVSHSSKNSSSARKKGTKSLAQHSARASRGLQTDSSAKKAAAESARMNFPKKLPKAANSMKVVNSSKKKSSASIKLNGKTKSSKHTSTKKAYAKPLSKTGMSAKKAKLSKVVSKQVEAKKLSGTKPAAKTPLKKAKDKRSVALQDFSQFRAILLEKRRRLYGDVAMMSEEALGSEEATVDNHAPIHPAEVGSHSFEQEFTLGLLSRDGDKIRLVDLALEKMAEGSYGVCDECGGRIPKGRLEMLPESIYCVKCASKLEGSGL